MPAPPSSPPASDASVTSAAFVAHYKAVGAALTALRKHDAAGAAEDLLRRYRRIRVSTALASAASRVATNAVLDQLDRSIAAQSSGGTAP